MRIIEPSVKIESTLTQDEALELIERAGRTCYKSEGNIKDGSAEKFVQGIIKHGHESVIEHVSITARVICDRGVSHEIVRHRIASYSQESTRYCNYASGKFDHELTFIKPCYWGKDCPEYSVWYTAMEQVERFYFSLIDMGATPQEARSVLPNSLKTEIVMTMNLREWRHFFRMRCAKAAHPQMQEVARMLLRAFLDRYPVFFKDMALELNEDIQVKGESVTLADAVTEVAPGRFAKGVI